MSAPEWTGRVVAGSGGAADAFEAFDRRRIRELSALAGYEPFPGTLNLRLSAPFDFTGPHVRGSVLHLTKEEAYEPRGVNLYPVSVEGHRGHVIRFDGARYSPSYVGMIAPVRLRDHVGDRVTLCLR